MVLEVASEPTDRRPTVRRGVVRANAASRTPEDSERTADIGSKAEMCVVLTEL